VADLLGTLRRTHTCGDLRPAHVGEAITLLGWVHRIRDMGSLVFIDVRDRFGLTQVVVRDDEALLDRAKQLKTEYVIAVIGEAECRSADTVNPRLATGEVEVLAREFRVLNEARRPPFPIADDGPVTEETRLRYRYLDLRRPRLQANMLLRHRVMMAIRRYFDGAGFVEIETPILTKSTPEGARDYLVPSRVHPGEFYALPQSPQIFKQILMIAGLDRYFQIVRCFRDEDLRADRQPEFTQVDVEISFADEDLVFSLIEPVIAAIFREIGVEVPLPFPRLPYAEAMARYGSDKPDLRFGVPIEDVSAAFAGSGFAPFREAVERGGVVRGIVVPGRGGASRRELDEFVDLARQLGAAGLVWVRRGPEGAIQSPALKGAGEPALATALDTAKAGREDLLLLAAGPGDEASKLLGQIRLQVAKQLGLQKPDEFAFTWVVDFPLFEWDEEEKRFAPMHHPFTSAAEADLGTLDTDPGAVRARAYDLVLNGSEIGGGSIRIHDPAMQARIFRLLNISDEDARLRFGFFLEALEFGTPPHGGIALGLDRIVAILSAENSIREVIAFPKTAAAVDLMAGAPSPVEERQLRDLHVSIRELTPRGGV
jgi:aspartyl-tRNA synthetase